MEINLQELSDDELNELISSIAAEQHRRIILETAETRVQEIEAKKEEEVSAVVGSYLTARDGEGNSEWVKPSGAHDCYPKGWTVVHGGKTWISLTPANVWEPGESGWRQLSEDGEPVPWVQPTGAHDSYDALEVVLHNGKMWESKVDGNVWEPPEQWKDVTPAAPAPEPPPAPVVPEWKQPTGGHDAYKIGDRVLFQGKVYESVVNGNTWSPADYPAGWKAVA